MAVPLIGTIMAEYVTSSLAVVAEAKGDLQIDKEWSHEEMLDYLASQLPKPFHYFSSMLPAGEIPRAIQLRVHRTKFHLCSGEDLDASAVIARLPPRTSWNARVIFLSEYTDNYILGDVFLTSILSG